MEVKTIDVDGDTLSATKVVSTNDKTFETPAKAVQPGKVRRSETVSPVARGVAELYAKVDAAGLHNSRKGWDGIAKNLRTQAHAAIEGEVLIPFVEYDDTAVLTEENALEIAKLQTNSGDVLPVPLMVPLVRAASNGDKPGEPQVDEIIENTRVYLEAVKELDIRKPVMGVIPPISQDCTLTLIALFADHGVRAFCVDFNRRSPMAQFQIDHVVNPLMQTLRDYDLMDQSFVYAVNARYSRPVTDDRRSPDALFAITLGFDVLGDNHIAPRLPKEVWEEIEEESEEEETVLRLFDAESVAIVEVPIDNLQSFLPSEAGISAARVKTRINQTSSERYRLEKIINAELISIYLGSEGGVDPSEIFVALSSAEYVGDSDLDRVRDLVEKVTG